MTISLSLRHKSSPNFLSTISSAIYLFIYFLSYFARKEI